MLSHPHGDMMGHCQPEALRHSQVLKHSDSDVEVVLMLTHEEVHMWRCLDLLTYVLDIQIFLTRLKFSLLLSISQIFFHIPFHEANNH